MDSLEIRLIASFETFELLEFFQLFDLLRF